MMLARSRYVVHIDLSIPQCVTNANSLTGNERVSCFHNVCSISVKVETHHCVDADMENQPPVRRAQ